MAGLDPAIAYPHQIANDAIAVSNHPMEMAGSSPTMTWLDRCVQYVNSKVVRQFEFSAASRALVL